MVQIPDSVRPYAVVLQKFHFWILAAIVPLVLLPLLFVAQAGIFGKIDAQRNKIGGTLSSIEAVLGNRPHPNEKWSQKIRARAREINTETLQVWEQAWTAQEPLRRWPDMLGNDFVKAASSLTSDGSLKRSLRERYQNEIRSVPRELPKRMGVDDLMGEPTVDAGVPPPASGQPPAPGQPPASASLAQWSQADQQQLLDSFNWEALPSTTQVVMAQEELWMYGVMCDVIRNVNSVPVAADAKVVITPANIAIPFVHELKVGYLAAEDDPGGREGQRIFRSEQPANADEMPVPGEAMAPEGGSASRPAHPRFGGGGQVRPTGIGQEGMGGEPEAVASPDEALKNWVYVDLDGKPLMATDLATVPAARIVRLMPFLVRVTIDQRALDALLVELASAPIPVDTRQVRINTGQASGGESGNRGSGRFGVQPPRFNDVPAGGIVGGDRARLHDVTAELRGTLAIVMRPDRSLLNVDDGSGQGEASE